MRAQARLNEELRMMNEEIFLWTKPFKVCVNLSYLCHLWSIEYPNS